MSSCEEIASEKAFGKEDEEQHQTTTTVKQKKDVETPKPGMRFNSINEVRVFYQKYAYKEGFGIMIRTSKSRKDGSNSKYYTIACEKGGKPACRGKSILLPHSSKKTNCKARLNIRTDKGGGFYLTKVFLDHNHGLSPAKSRYFRCNKQLDAHAKRRLELNDEAGIPLHKSFQSLVVEAGSYENLPFGEKECRNHIDKVRKLRLGEGDAESLNNYFVRMQNQNSNFFYVLDVNEDSQVRNVFWADARSRAVYESFGDVVTFDTTYLTKWTVHFVGLWITIK